MPPLKASIEERLAKYTKKTDTCWLWIGATCEGYGIIGIKGQSSPARRIYYELYKNKIPAHECLLSICKNKLCVNPDHHFLQDEKLEFYIKKNDLTNCWEWLRNTNNKNYGMICHKGKMRLAHRVFYEKYKNEIPRGMNVCHSCDNSKCCNPEHLFLGTQADNVHDMENKKRDNKSKGEKHFKAKISKKEVMEVRKKFNEGTTIREVYHLFNYSYQTIYYICINKTWKHLIILGRH
jgi:hypothetical protein